MSGSNSSNPGADAERSDSRLGAEGLMLTVHPMPSAHVEATPADARQRRSGRLRMLMVLAACAAPVIASYVTYFFVRPEGRTNYAEFMAPTRAWPAAIPLTDAQGAAVDPSIWRRQWTLVVFARGACDAACEKQIYTQRQLREMLGRERERLDKVVVLIDDTVLEPRLAAALAATPAVRVVKASGAPLATWLGTTPEDLQARLYLVDPMGEWMMRTPATPEPGKFKRDLERLLRASASWDRAGRD